MENLKEISEKLDVHRDTIMQTKKNIWKVV